VVDASPNSVSRGSLNTSAHRLAWWHDRCPARLLAL
jgi:hypothetical protein